MPDASDSSAPDSTAPDYRGIAFPPAPAGRPYVISNMVTSVDGRAAIEGTERGLGSDADRRLMRELRMHADIVLTGAGTLRATGTSSRLGDPALEALRVARGKRERPIAAVLSASGNLPLDRAFFTARDFEAVVYLSDRAPAAVFEALLGTGRRVVMVPHDDAVAAMLRHMREELDATLLLLEGGPTLLGQFVTAGCLDECFVTLGPVIVGGDRDVQTPVVTSGAPRLDAVTRLELLATLQNPATSEVYLRYRVVR